MRVLVTGGAGYIGAHVVRLLQQRHDDVIVADDLVTGDTDRLRGVPLIELDLASDRAVEVLEHALRAYSIQAVIHLAARKQVAESVARPAWYYQQNIGSLANLLQAMERVGVGHLIFSSSAAVYGDLSGSISEDSLARPINPYGHTKLVGEQMIEAATKAFDLRAVSLRYFNVAGAGWSELGDRAALNLVPMVFERLDAGEAPVIFGNDYDTPDGTCVRDFVHVLDVADAHLVSLDALDGRSGPPHRVYNIGTGVGSSVREVVESIARHAKLQRETRVSERRSGDPAFVVATVDRIRTELGWTARFSLDEAVRSAWESHRHFSTRRDAEFSLPATAPASSGSATPSRHTPRR